MHLKMSSGKWRTFCLGLNVLTHYGLVMPYHMATQIWVDIGSDNGLLPNDTKPLPEPMLNPDLGIHYTAISQKMLVCWQRLSFEIRSLKISMHLPEANKLIQ